MTNRSGPGSQLGEERVWFAGSIPAPLPAPSRTDKNPQRGLGLVPDASESLFFSCSGDSAFGTFKLAQPVAAARNSDGRLRLLLEPGSGGFAIAAGASSRVAAPSTSTQEGQMKTPKKLQDELVSAVNDEPFWAARLKAAVAAFVADPNVDTENEVCDATAALLEEGPS